MQHWTPLALLTGDTADPVLATVGAGQAVRLWHLSAGVSAGILRCRRPVRCLAARGLLLAIGVDEGLTVIELDPTAITPVGHPCGWRGIGAEGTLVSRSGRAGAGTASAAPGPR